MTRAIDPYEHFAHEGDYPELDYDAAARRLSAALALRTVYTTPERTDFSPFDELYELICGSYPEITRHGTFERVGHSVLVTVPGTEPALPAALLLAHQDVVDVVPGTEGQWEHDPFGGHLDDEWIWGRGALDIKEMLMGELEAVEHLLSHHGRPRRTIVLAFGEDEEADSRGATALAAELARRGVRAAFSLDEGVTTFADAAAYGAPGLVMTDVCLSQKGYLNVRLVARGAGGHSSNPFGGTSLERVCVAVARLVQDAPAPRLTPVVAETFRRLAPHVTEEPLRTLVADVDANAEKIARVAAGTRELFPLVCTTMAVDQIEGSAASANVMPADASATINFRLLPGTGVDDVVSWVRATVGDLVEVEPLHGTPAGRVDEAVGLGYDELVDVLERYHPGTVVVPSIVCGGTDSVRYEGVCDKLLRVTPFRPAPDELARGLHGVNERISRRAYAQGIRVMVALLERTVLSGAYEERIKLR